MRLRWLLCLGIAVYAQRPQIRFQEDIPDINCHYTGRQRIIDDLDRPLNLWTGGSRRGDVRLGSVGGSRDELECVMDARAVLLDVIVWDFGLETSSFELGDEKLSPYFAGDLLLTCGQAKSLLDLLDPEGAPDNRRSVSLADLIQKWDRTIYYTYDEEIGDDAELRDMIRSAFELWSRDTCLEFREFNMRPGAPPADDFIVFAKRGGCASMLGRVGGAQSIHLGQGGCRNTGIITHLIGHSLGLLHGQQRMDAGGKVAVDWRGLKPAFADAFLPVPGYRPSTPFDYGSIMLSKTSAFAKDPMGEPIAEPEAEGFEYTMGAKRTGPSFYDVKEVNRMYCSQGSGYSECRGRETKFGGYRAPWDCQREICPEGYTWQGCGTMKDGEPAFCGGLLFAGSSPRDFQSPAWPGPMQSGQTCNWVIHAPTARHKVQLEFLDMNLPRSQPCQWGFVEIRAGNDSAATGQRYCGTRAPAETVTSDERQMLVFLRSNDEEGAGGFRARYWASELPDSDPPPREGTRTCRDRISARSCRAIFADNNRCDAPKAGQLCAWTCRRCDEQGRSSGPCRDELSRESCRLHFIATDRCDTPRARMRCRESCGQCEGDGRRGGDRRDETRRGEDRRDGERRGGGSGFKQNLDADDIVEERRGPEVEKEVGDPPVMGDMDNRVETYFVTEDSFAAEGRGPPEEQFFHLDCDASGAVPIIYEWWRRTETGWTARVARGVDEVQASNDGRRLRFNNPRASAAGVYRCTARNLFGTAVSQEFAVRAASTERDEDIGAVGGREERARAVGGRWISLPCRPARLQTKPTPEITWYRRPVGWSLNDSLLIKDGDYDRLSISADHDLVFHHIRESDTRDHYFCRLRNEATGELVYGSTFYLSGNDELTPFRGEEILSSAEQVEGVVGKSVQLDCFRSGYPISDATPEWYKDGQRVGSSSHYHARNGGKSLYTPEATPEDAGSFECRFGRSIRVNFRLRLASPPRWDFVSDESWHVSVPDLTRSVVRGICSVSGSPEPRVSIFHNGYDGVRVAEGVRVRGIGLSSDVSRDAPAATYGVYQCRAENEHGTIWANVYQASPRHQFPPIGNPRLSSPRGRPRGGRGGRGRSGRGDDDDLVERARRSAACEDSLNESACVLHVLGVQGCEVTETAQRCRRTCGLCQRPRDTCARAGELCHSGGPLGGFLCRASPSHPHLRPWCQDCGHCLGEHAESAESTDSAESSTAIEEEEETEEEGGVCEDELSYEECMDEVLGEENCLGERASECEATCGLCHADPDDSCRLQRLDCGTERCGNPETPLNVLNWCRGCGFCALTP